MELPGGSVTAGGGLGCDGCAGAELCPSARGGTESCMDGGVLQSVTWAAACELSCPEAEHAISTCMSAPSSDSQLVRIQTIIFLDSARVC